MLFRSSFLVEVGVLEVNAGTYTEVVPGTYKVDYNTTRTYGQKVTSWRSFETTVTEWLLEQATFFFELKSEHQQEAWYALLTEVYHDFDHNCTFKRLVDI